MIRVVMCAALLFSVGLAGCATVDPIAQQEAARQAEQNQVYGEMHQTDQQQLAKLAANKAQYLKQVGPSYPYAKAVQDGVIVMGMTEGAIDAAGYDCQTKEHSAIGSVDACTNLVQAFSTDGAAPAPYYVGFNADGYVVSVQNP